MARWRVVVTTPYARTCIDTYRQVLEAAGCDVVTAFATERLDEGQLLELLPGAHGIICGDDRICAQFRPDAINDFARLLISSPFHVFTTLPLTRRTVVARIAAGRRDGP